MKKGVRNGSFFITVLISLWLLVLGVWILYDIDSFWSFTGLAVYDNLWFYLYGFACSLYLDLLRKFFTSWKK